MAVPTISGDGVSGLRGTRSVLGLTVPDSEREALLAPAAVDGVDIAAAHAAALDLDVDVVVAKRLGLELVLVELEPGVRSVDLESGELVRIRHGGGRGESSESASRQQAWVNHRHDQAGAARFKQPLAENHLEEGLPTPPT